MTIRFLNGVLVATKFYNRKEITLHICRERKSNSTFEQPVLCHCDNELEFYSFRSGVINVKDSGLFV